MTTSTLPSRSVIIDDLREKAAKELNTSLFKFSNRKTKWEHPTPTPMGFNDCGDWDVRRDIHNAHYGKNTEFKYTVLAHKDDHPIIAYYKPGSNEYGYGVMDEDGGDFCLEVTTYGLAHWIVDSNVSDYELPKATALLHKVMNNAAALSK